MECNTKSGFLTSFSLTMFVIVAIQTLVPSGISLRRRRIGVNQKHLKLIHRSDGYEYRFTPIDPDLLRFSAI